MAWRLRWGGRYEVQQKDLSSLLVSVMVLFFSALLVHVALDPQFSHQIDFLG